MLQCYSQSTSDKTLTNYLKLKEKQLKVVQSKFIFQWKKPKPYLLKVLLLVPVPNFPKRRQGKVEELLAKLLRKKF